MLVTNQYVKELFKKRKPTAHKGDYGRVLVIGGSADYTGAVYLAAKAIAALRGGADIVTIAAPAKVAWALNSLSPDLITRKLYGNFITLRNLNFLSELMESHDIILIGPGIGLRKETIKAVRRIVKTDKPKVLDADALKAVDLNDLDNSILTPHKKEFEVLLGNSNLNERNFQQKLKSNVILLKGKQDRIFSRTKRAENTTGSAGMTVGGTGDILSGLCAGILAVNRENLFKTACAAAYINGLCGEELEKSYGYGFIASDFLGVIAKKVREEFW